jgi:hypothetical protein
LSTLGSARPGRDANEHFCASQQQASSNGGQSVCQLAQLPATTDCSNSMNPGWCYVEGGRTGCAQAISFSQASPPPGSLTTLACIETNMSVIDSDAGR